MKPYIAAALIATVVALSSSSQAGFPSSGRYTPGVTGCAATNGQLDLSFCSNAFYLATVF